MKACMTVLLFSFSGCVSADVAEPEPDVEPIRRELTVDGVDYVVLAERLIYPWYSYYERIDLYRSSDPGEPIDTYFGPAGYIDMGIAADDILIEDFTGDGEPEVVVPLDTGGNDALICLGLLVFAPTPEGFRELFARHDSAPLYEDLDGDGSVEVYTFSAYASSFMLARVHRASFVNTVYHYDGENYTVADPLDYRPFFVRLVSEKGEYYESTRDRAGHPKEILRDAQSLLAQMAFALMDEEYVRWWEGHEDELRSVTMSIDGGDWSEVERDFATPGGFRAQF